MDTRVELEFADGKYSFWLPMPQVVAIERGPSAHRHDGHYPKSIFTIYDQLGAGLGIADGKPVYLSGGSALIGDARNVILNGLLGGNGGTVDGDEIEVGPRKAEQLVADFVYPARPATEALHLAWSILHAAIVGIDVKKKEADAVDEPSHSEKGNSSPTADSLG